MTELVELTYAECIDLLRSDTVGRIAVHADPYPLVVPVNYRLVEQPGPGRPAGDAWIAIRTRPGNRIDRAPMFVSFEIDGIDPVHRIGWSVLVAGTLHVVDDEASEFRTRFDPNPWLDDDRERWLVIEAARITGRQLVAAPTEWAFSVAAYL